MTRWQVFGGRWDGYRIDTYDDGTDVELLSAHTEALNQSKLTVHDIDHPGHQLIITIPNQEHA